MTSLQAGSFVASLVILFATAGAVQLGWLGDGRAKMVVVFLAGVSVILSLRLGGLPLWWFSASKGAFGLAASLIVGAFLSSIASERSFQLPLLLGLGLTLLIVNIVQFARNVL